MRYVNDFRDMKKAIADETEPGWNIEPFI